MKKIIRLTERDLTRIVKRTIKEMKFSDDEEFDSENELSSYDLCKNMGYLVHNDFATGMLTKEKVTEILYNYRLTASRYFRKKLISSEEYQEISDCYEESMSELENPEYNKLNENEDQDQTRHSENTSLKFMQDEIDEIAVESYDIDHFNEMIEEFYKEFNKELNNLSDRDYRTLENYIDDVSSSIRMSDYGDKDHYRGW